MRVEGVQMIGSYMDSHKVWFVFSDEGERASRVADAFYNSPGGKWCHDLLRQYRLLRGLMLDMRDRVRTPHPTEAARG